MNGNGTILKQKDTRLPSAEACVRAALIDALIAGDDRTIDRVLLALLTVAGGRFAIFLSKHGRQPRQLYGVRRDGSLIGRPDKLLLIDHLNSTLRRNEPMIECDTPRRGEWRLSVPVELGDVDSGALFVGGQAAIPTSSVQRDLRSAGIHDCLKAALRIDALQEECYALRGEHRNSSTDRALAAVAASLESSSRESIPKRLLERFPSIVTQSRAMRQVLTTALVAADSDLPVLLEGESGTGKEVVARAIHEASSRAGNPYVTENCGAIPDTLIESELFGHTRGGFTGASKDQPGLFERACGGTIFLDEIGEMEIGAQRKLLRVLQEKRVRRIGASEIAAVDFRVIAATNRVLEEMVSEGKFRNDLFYRLNALTINLPPLRDRIDDIPRLVEHFVRQARSEGRNAIEFTDDAVAVLKRYPWPGNVRELQNEILRLSCSEGGAITPDKLVPRIARATSAAGQSYWPKLGRRARSLNSVEREVMGSVIQDALQRANGNRAEAARRLGITRASLYRRMVRYGLVT